MDMNMRDEYEC